MKAFFDRFQNLNSASFISLKGYTDKYNGVADVVLNANVNVMNAKKKDLKDLKALTENDLMNIATEKNLPLDVLKKALAELIASSEKNLSKNLDERTNASKAQANTYLHATKSIKMHKDTCNIFVEGFLNKKTVIVEGDYPTRNKQVKTLCKEAIAKYADLRMNKYRIYNVGQMNQLKISGTTLQFIHLK